MAKRIMKPMRAARCHRRTAYTARELLERLQEEQPGAYAVGLLRTLQRRLKIWRRDKAHELVFGATSAGVEPELVQLHSVT